MDPSSLRIAFVGFGEVGGILGAALGKTGVASVSAFDILASDPAWSAKAMPRAKAAGVVLTKTLPDALGSANLVISAVTAAATETAATQIAHAAAPGTVVLDVNSASPRTKEACAAVTNAAGLQYVEAAVMSSVPPHGLRVPMLLGGPHAQAAMPMLEALGFDAKVASPSYGVASAIKLCRSVVIKGMEALAVESMLTARRYGVEEEVLESLAETYPGMKWDRQVDYFWRRVYQHGRRRAEEMREAAVMVRDAGSEARMASATASMQAWIAALRANGAFEGLAGDIPWQDLADRIAREKS